ncbi:hypothetical protein IAQ61_005630 [Plenodomus lingam]|uniref:uncharacterized protein n=1 Tax=Leptosphaeria maculans TaxID=5022 RepID=UPI00331803F4|nr:hypothetical protein IAQ61_005630 [Plenodomus lingam]
MQNKRSDNLLGRIVQTIPPSLFPSPAQPSLISLAGIAAPPISPFNFGSPPSSNNPGKAFTPVLPKSHKDEHTSYSRLAGRQPPNTLVDQQKPTRTTNTSSTLMPLFKIETFEDLLAWVRTFLDIDSAHMKSFHTELKEMYDIISAFESLTDLQAKARYECEAFMRTKDDEIKALEKDIARTSFSYSKKSKVIQLENLQSELSSLKRVTQEQDAKSDGIRDRFTKALLAPLKTFSRLNEMNWQTALNQKQNIIAVLQAEVGGLNGQASWLVTQNEKGREDLKTEALTRKRMCGSECQSKLEKFQKDLRASREMEAVLTERLSTAITERDSAFAVHQHKLAEEAAQKTRLENELAAKASELSLQENTFQTKYREKMNEKLASLKQEQERAVQIQKQKYEAQIDIAHSRAPLYAEAESKLSVLERQIKQLVKEKVDLNMAKATLEKQLHDIKARGKQLQSFEDAYEQVKREFDELQSTYNDVEVERDELKQQLSALKNELKISTDARLDAPDSRRTNGNAQRPEDEHTRSVAVHWENQLKSKMRAVDKKTADLASCDEEIVKLQLSKCAEASSSKALLPPSSPSPPRPVSSGQLLDVGVIETEAQGADTHAKLKDYRSFTTQQTNYIPILPDATADPKSSDQLIRTGVSSALAPTSSKKEPGVCLGKPEIGEAACLEVLTRKIVNAKARKL